MGRPNSCFKIITCGGDSSAEKDDIDIQAPENKRSSDKRGWSFRKRSASHRVLSNSATSEASSAANKESIQPASLNYQQRDTGSVPEKKLVTDCIDEKPPLSISVDEKASKTTANNESTEPASLNYQQQDTASVSNKKSVAESIDEKPPLSISVDEIASKTTAHKESSESDSVIYQQKDSASAPDDKSGEESIDEKPPLSTSEDKKASKITENVESFEPANLNHQQQDAALVPKEISVAECTDEKPALSISADEKGSKTIALDKSGKEVEAHVEESVAIILQSSARTFMAQKELARLKSVVKLQAAIRGHLVRQRALGSLRCVQAIVKMQMLIRAKHARTLGSNVEIGEDKKKASPKTSKMELSIAKPPVTYTSLQKLLSSRFARQLMESTPKSRPINIKCDPLQPNSAWTWFERWTAPSPVEPTPKPERSEKVEEEKKEEYASPVEESEGSRVIDEKKAEYDSPEEESEGFHVVEEKKDEYDSPLEESEGFHVVEVKKEEYVSSLEESECSQVVQDSKSNIKEVVSSPKSEETPIAYYDASNSSFKRCHSVEDKLEQPQGDASIRFDDAKETLVCLQGQEWEQPGSPQRSIKRLATEELHNDQEKEILHGPKKVSDPAFVATLSKFEGLNSTTDSNKASLKDALIITKESSMTDNSVDNIARACDVDSEWGPKHSTLDSPNHISEVGAAEHKEVTISDNPRTWKHVGDEESKNTLEDEFVNQPEEIIGGENEAIMVQQEQEAGSGGAVVACKSSPEASLRSHMTINAEPHGTPGSQVSVSKSEKSERRASSSNKRKSLSAGQKKLGSSPKTHSAKDEEKGKRRSSFGSPRREDEATEKQEPRPSNGNSSSLPRFMLATESARAKLQLNNSSPRSSPDASDREYIKKRHSLPGANGKEGSPQIKRTFSQAESVPKPNASLTSREKKWQR